MPTINIKTSAHSEMINITEKIAELIPSNIQNGLCCVFSVHTTAAITINENADPDVCSDMVRFMEKMVPWNESMFRHFEGNSAAHIKSSLMGFSQIIPIENGRLVLGTWQGIYFCEYDGPRNRKVHITFM
jgi:secondary thiamine-phosphate synthase enzyme